MNLSKKSLSLNKSFEDLFAFAIYFDFRNSLMTLLTWVHCKEVDITLRFYRLEHLALLSLMRL